MTWEAEPPFLMPNISGFDLGAICTRYYPKSITTVN